MVLGDFGLFLVVLGGSSWRYEIRGWFSVVLGGNEIVLDCSGWF